MRLTLFSFRRFLPVPKDVEAQMFYPSTLALVAVTLVDKQGLLPADCKRLMMQLVEVERGRLNEVEQCVATFEGRCIPPCPGFISSSGDANSSGRDSWGMGWRMVSDDNDSRTTYASSGTTFSESEHDRNVAT